MKKEKSDRVLAMLKFATEKHKGQTRKHINKPYIMHPIAVSVTVSEYTSDDDVIIAAIGHDLLEDTDTSEDEIRRTFGGKVYDLIVSTSKVTDLNGDKFNSLTRLEKIEIDNEHFASGDADAHLIKTADILDNLKDSAEGSLKWQKRFVSEKLTQATMLDKAPMELRIKLADALRNRVISLFFESTEIEIIKELQDNMGL